jgi:peptidoglycan/xylan/chitin deacetylase (PgdA/CDA1 family)
MPDPRTVIAVNYHRIGVSDAANPYHRLHTIPAEVFGQQLGLMQHLGRIVSPSDVRDGNGLADINFVICFDDVPISAMQGIDAVRGRGLPVTVSVCGHLARDGRGTRDKVYAIEKFADPDLIETHIRSRLPAPPGGADGISFYHLTKHPGLDPRFVRAELVVPLFATVERQARAYFAQRGYLSWPQVRCLAADPLITIANHTLSHDNLAALPADALAEEIHRSHAYLLSQTGRPARYFTIPFGRFTQGLALDCLTPLTALGYEGILWVGAAGIVVRGPYRRQVLHLPRLHAATSTEGFADQVRQAIHDSLDGVVWQSPPRPHRRRVTVAASSDASRSCLLEMVMRQGKDYASDPDFYRYQFTDNPHRDDRPDYYAVECDGRIEATAYNFHTAFAIGEAVVPGVYLSSWRKLPHAHPTAAARLLHTMLAREPIVGVYDPNPAIHRAFTGWHQVRVHRLTIPVSASPADPDVAGEQRYRAREQAAFPGEFDTLCAASLRRAGFTAARDATYQAWRHGRYPLATATFVGLYRAGEPVAIAAVLHRGTAMSVADFHLRSNLDAAPLMRAVLAFAARGRAETVDWQTSSDQMAALGTGTFGAHASTFVNFYHLNTAALARLGLAGLEKQWPRLAFHETGTTGDVLLR